MKPTLISILSVVSFLFSNGMANSQHLTGTEMTRCELANEELTMTQYQMQWLNELYSTWLQDKPTAVITARLNPQMFDNSMLFYIREMARELGLAAIIDGRMENARDLLNSYFGHQNDPLRGFQFQRQQQSSFFLVMYLIAVNEGDPPSHPSIRNRALDILLGNISAEGVRALMLDMAEQNGPVAIMNMQYIFNYAQYLGIDINPFIVQLLRVFAALALPRTHLSRFMSNGVELRMRSVR